MKEYEIEVEEILQRIIKINAKSKEDAISIIKERYRNEKIVLDAEDLKEVNFR